MTEGKHIDTLRTARLLLRQWQPADEAAMAEINQDPEVARHLNRPVDGAAGAAFYGQMCRHWEDHGYGPWALESREPDRLGEFLGFAGLAHVPPFLAEAGPDPELGWRLKRSAWGQGLATEAAVAARDDAFRRLGLPEMISIIHPENVRSQRVATKLGMRVARRIDNPAIGRRVDVWSVASGPVDVGRHRVT
ncbi:MULTISPECIES: GNAT family N-acetyltransferase [unclassified Frankia]|uniref:GNAT family N-acetyltransferase n=1 Tax=unclassified Frankia TaxID=2632575 RepID=UPI0006CA3033|nr:MULTISPECIES: GNAT family N-acetyltransferase [unclassified Frankia]